MSLDHSFSADKNELFSNEVALLRCSATIRYPPLSSISIVKNNITLQITTGTTLSVRTGRMGVSTFGLYWCRVNTTGAPIISLKVIIKEKGEHHSFLFFLLLSSFIIIIHSSFEDTVSNERTFGVQRRYCKL